MLENLFGSFGIIIVIFMIMNIILPFIICGIYSELKNLRKEMNLCNEKNSKLLIEIGKIVYKNKEN